MCKVKGRQIWQNINIGGSEKEFKCFLCFQYTILSNLYKFEIFQGFPGGSVVKNLPAMQEMQETWVSSLGWEDSLEKEMATHSSILAWRIPWTEEPGGPWGCRVRQN